MTIQAEGNKFIIEMEGGAVYLIRKTDGMGVVFGGVKYQQQVRECLKTHEADEVAQTFIDIASPERPWQFIGTNHLPDPRLPFNA